MIGIGFVVFWALILIAMLSIETTRNGGFWAIPAILLFIFSMITFLPDEEMIGNEYAKLERGTWNYSITSEEPFEVKGDHQELVIDNYLWQTNGGNLRFRPLSEENGWHTIYTDGEKDFDRQDKVIIRIINQNGTWSTKRVIFGRTFGNFSLPFKNREVVVHTKS